ncbi:hypothetical protein AM493_02155 [Flavobacterium akiainvivens]|uniref:Uncharacterized protein n=1 Tax=Flavobacterium akiainvivens TaxID=1202724 RepID=A0A0M8MB38_9FLAO|nr:hypothetical protein [Flavobacterium akiainvivens]KOS04974.1 hypothetical protein AM493_02155 [Flavobacterium akiainvivens]SFQ41183.1 hypothetical protein SAMN05444144_10488 [Flavobacterium akiainvivens]
MSEFVVVGDHITVASIRSYLFAKRIDKGDTLVLNPMDYEHLVGDIKESGEPIDIPLNVLGVLLAKDPSGDVPVGKVQIVKNEKL